MPAKGANLPLGIPAALQASAQATMQIRSSDGECLSAAVSDIKKQEAEFFKRRRGGRRDVVTSGTGCG
jgi:hypothetical protein